MLGIDPTTNPQNILPAYDPDSAAGVRDAHSDVVFYSLTFTDEPISRQHDVSTDDEGNRIVKYVRNLRIEWVCYGDDSFEWADTIRIMFFDPDILAEFAAQGITLITDVPAPTFVPEPKGNEWYLRYDVSARFNQLVTRQAPQPTIDSLDITLMDDKGVIQTWQS